MNEFVCIEILQSVMGIYQELFHPLCKEAGVSYSALGILLLLGSDPDCKTARDICSSRCIKPNIVSFNVDKLVSMGYLERRSVENDRRKIKLVPTKKAEPVINKGLELKEKIHDYLLKDLGQEDKKKIMLYLETIKNNVIELKKTQNLI